MTQTKKTFYLIAFIFVIVIAILIMGSLINGLYQIKTSHYLCKEKGFDSNGNVMGDDRVVEGINYVRCCNSIIKENEFVKECKIFNKKTGALM